MDDKAIDIEKIKRLYTRLIELAKICDGVTNEIEMMGEEGKKYSTPESHYRTKGEARSYHYSAFLINCLINLNANNGVCNDNTCDQDGCDPIRIYKG